MQSDDFDIEPGLSFGTWLHSEIVDECVIESTGWAPERAQRVAARLQSVVPEGQRFIVLVPWMDEVTAFTAPGKYIYLTRRLLERCPDDDSAAFVVAHEIAHHELGHLRMFPHWLAALARVRNGWMAAVAVQKIDRTLYGPENESAADHRALDLCLVAGFDGKKCIHTFEILAQYALEMGDIEGTFGLDTESEDVPAGETPWTTKLRTWAWERMRGYPSTEERRAALLRYLEFRTTTHVPNAPRPGFS
ncbi:MAG TPA: M48 family metalloprotease [Gemmatimonadaceae bacterium]|nr:M48 family metalloprotease [Gemmatimonadaceae bacterium]